MNIPARAYVHRAHERHALALPVRVLLRSAALQGQTVNVSSGGVMIRLPLPMGLAALRDVQAVVISGLGHFDCRTRWVADERFGVEFLDTRRAAEMLGGYLARRTDTARPEHDVIP